MQFRMMMVCLACIAAVDSVATLTLTAQPQSRVERRMQRQKRNNAPAAGVAITPAPADPNTTAPDATEETDLRPRRKRGNARLNAAPPEPIIDVNAIKITTGEAYDSQPVVAQTANGDTHLAYVRYNADEQDQIVVTTYRAGRPTERTMRVSTVTPTPGQYVRPVLTAIADELWCFWTTTQESAHACIYYSRLQGETWSAPARLLPDEFAAHQNPEVASSASGKLTVAYQIFTGKSYDIATRTWDGSAWQAPTVVSNPDLDDWDPAVAYDMDNQLHTAWSAYDQGDYDVYYRKGPGTPRRLSARGDYDMHPWLAPAPDGTMWVSWDAVRIDRHGYSGNSTITGANLRKYEVNKESGEHGDDARWSGIEVRVLDGDTVRIPGNPREEIVAPRGYKIAHRALGKIAVSPDGVPWIIYRALCQPSPAWDPGSNAGYYWELQARAFKDGKWQEPLAFIESDGYLEEPGLALTRKGIQVAYSSEHRRSATRKVEYLVKHAESHQHDASTTDPIEAHYDHHHDFDGFLGWDGDVYLAQLGAAADPQQPAPALAAGLPAEDKPADKPVDERLSRTHGRHSATVAGETYNLYWGDTHRHSNVSRCSVGNEPSPDDLYRYGLDVNLYDFVALSDHGEHMTDFYWWKQQKTADLYHVPGFHSVLYNYEWSMNFPDGHHNAIFPTRSSIKINGKLGAASTMIGGWEILSLGGYKAITAPHTSADPGMGTDWNAHDDRYQRVCEIFQACRGSYEHDGCPRQHKNATNKAGFYWKGLEKGYKMGIICSSDHGFGAAYACTYSTTNTREAIWQSIWDRRCYGATSYGIVADVRSGDHWMGEEFSSAAAPELSVYVRGSSPIRSIEILGRSKVLHAVGSVDNPINTMEHRLTWTDPEWDTLSGENWYYVRIIQQDDEMAWTSPMWITKAAGAAAAN